MDPITSTYQRDRAEFAQPSPSKAMPAETPGSAYGAMSDAAKEAADASEQFIAARNRWNNAQAQLAEASDRVGRSRESLGI